MYISISEYIYMYLLTYLIITFLYKIINIIIVIIIIIFKNIKDYKMIFDNVVKTID